MQGSGGCQKSLVLFTANVATMQWELLTFLVQRFSCWGVGCVLKIHLAITCFPVTTSSQGGFYITSLLIEEKRWFLPKTVTGLPPSLPLWLSSAPAGTELAQGRVSLCLLPRTSSLCREPLLNSKSPAMIWERLILLTSSIGKLPF